jgi:SAM-dependent methyltransferase
VRASPYEWLLQPLQAEEGLILDVACGSAPTRPLLPGTRWIGLDVAAAELRSAAAAGRVPLVRGNAAALPIATDSVSAVCAALCLQVLTPLDTVLAEVHRVLRPGGVLVALVPATTDPATGRTAALERSAACAGCAPTAVAQPARHHQIDLDPAPARFQHLFQSAPRVHPRHPY